MLSELRVSQLGVIEDLTLLLGPGMTALTGETGAGKTLVVEAIELLLGGRAEGVLVRPGAAEALVEGRFVLPTGLEQPGSPDEGGPFERAPESGPAGATGSAGAIEVVLSRAVPVDGRSRAYLDGRMASVGALAELGERLVDLHGQHAHQSLLSGAAQRDALDSYAGADRRPREAARAALREIDEALARAGRDEAGRSGEMELLRYQLAELSAAQIKGPGEDTELAVEEERLGKAAAHRAAAEAVYEDLSGDEQVLDRVGNALARIAAHPPLAALHERLKSVAAELADLASEARETAEGLEEDPERLAEVVSRRAVLRELRRKYAGPAGSLADVLTLQEDADKRLDELEGLEELSAHLAEERAHALAKLRRAAAELGDARRAASTALGEGVESGIAPPGDPTCALRGEGRRPAPRRKPQQRRWRGSRRLAGTVRRGRHVPAGGEPGRAVDASVQGGFGGRAGAGDVGAPPGARWSFERARAGDRQGGDRQGGDRQGGDRRRG